MAGKTAMRLMKALEQPASVRVPARRVVRPSARPSLRNVLPGREIRHRPTCGPEIARRTLRNAGGHTLDVGLHYIH